MRLWVVLLVLVPSAAATPVDLYFHSDGYQDFPITTQMPDPDYEASPALGSATHSTCIESPGPTGMPYHAWHGYGAPSPVTYDDRPRYYSERGLAPSRICAPSKSQGRTSTANRIAMPVT